MSSKAGCSLATDALFELFSSFNSPVLRALDIHGRVLYFIVCRPTVRKPTLTFNCRSDDLRVVAVKRQWIDRYLKYLSENHQTSCLLKQTHWKIIIKY